MNGSLLCRVDCHIGGIRKLRLLRKKYRETIDESIDSS